VEELKDTLARSGRVEVGDEEGERPDEGECKYKRAEHYTENIMNLRTNTSIGKAN
jgi:hypothetical protein